MLPKSLCIPCAHRVGYLEKYFEFDIRNPDPCIGGQPPGTFGVRHRFGREPPRQTPGNPPKALPPFHAARSHRGGREDVL